MDTLERKENIHLFTIPRLIQIVAKLVKEDAFSRGTWGSYFLELDNYPDSKYNVVCISYAERKRCRLERSLPARISLELTEEIGNPWLSLICDNKIQEYCDIDRLEGVLEWLFREINSH